MSFVRKTRQNGGVPHVVCENGKTMEVCRMSFVRKRRKQVCLMLFVRRGKMEEKRDWRAKQTSQARARNMCEKPHLGRNKKVKHATARKAS